MHIDAHHSLYDVHPYVYILCLYCAKNILHAYMLSMILCTWHMYMYTLYLLYFVHNISMCIQAIPYIMCIIYV